MKRLALSIAVALFAGLAPAAAQNLVITNAHIVDGKGGDIARLLWNAGISYGYGTDTSRHPRETLRDELRALNLTFSPRDIVRIMGLNAARSALKDKELGSLEPGKLADIVVVNGNPNEDSSALLHVMTTIKGGVVMVEKR